MRYLMLVVLMGAGCGQQPTAPTSPSAVPEAKFVTSRVNPADFTVDDLEHLSLDHNPFDEGVSMCRTMRREYCDAHDTSNCWWETDYYTVMRPDVCPVEPIP